MALISHDIHQTYIASEFVSCHHRVRAGAQLTVGSVCSLQWSWLGGQSRNL